MALKERIGTVVSDKMDKTVVVAVINRYPHPTYKKIVSRTTRYKALLLLLLTDIHIPLIKKL